MEANDISNVLIQNPENKSALKRVGNHVADNLDSYTAVVFGLAVGDTDGAIFDSRNSSLIVAASAGTVTFLYSLLRAAYKTSSIEELLDNYSNRFIKTMLIAIGSSGVSLVANDPAYYLAPLQNVHD